MNTTTAQASFSKVSASNPQNAGLLQRTCACGKHTSVPGSECEECRQNREIIQRAAISSSNRPGDESATRNPQNELPSGLRAKMERSLGANFAGVRIHTQSSQALSLSAQAYTRGNDIHIAPGYWNPTSSRGQELIGHELGHVLQQRAGRVRATTQISGAAVNAEAHLEQEAELAGRRAAQGEGVANQSGFTEAVASGTIAQRLPLPPTPGSATDRVMQALAAVNPVAGVGDFPAAFGVLDGLTMEDLLPTLVDLQERTQLDLLIANAGSAAAFHQARLVTSMQVVRQSRGPGANPATAQATIAAAAGLLPAEITALNTFASATPIGTTRAADQRIGTALPNADLTREIGYELDPSSRPAPAAPPPPPQVGVPAPPPPPPPARVPWDGSTGAAGAAAARTAMQNELFAAYDAYLTAFRATTVAALAQPRVAFTSAAAAAPAAGQPPATGVVDIANQARSVLETRYATSMDAASSSPRQVGDRSVRVGSGAGQNIFDISSEADRSTLTGSADLAPGVAWWLFENDVPGAANPAGSRRFATDILAAHHYSTQDPGAEQFRWDVANAYAAANTLAPSNRRQLIDYRMTGWSERGDRGITLQSAFTPGANPARAELEQRWDIFKTATHESLHLRAHPAFSAADLGRGAMKEGFTEMFTISTLNTDVLPRVRSGSMEALRRTVEGTNSPAAPDATLITNATTPTQYAAHRAQAERIRDGGTAPGGSPHTGIGESGVRAAYFEGHVEYLGLEASGAQLAGQPAAGAPVQVRIPPGMNGLDELAVRSGVPRATIVADNPGITNALPATAILAGCREHRVVAGETRANIAAQNGVSEADLVRANPDIHVDLANNWPTLTSGQRILIPVH